MATMISPDPNGTYPIVLSDSLAGKRSNEIFTGIQYNHKPEGLAKNGFTSHTLKPLTAHDTKNYDLAITDSDGAAAYAYEGTRNASDGQYVLLFDAAKKHFVLHQLDSTFDMNLASTPDDADPDALRSAYPQIASALRARKKGGAAAAAKAKAKPKPKKTRAPARAPTPEAAAEEEGEEEEEDSDDGFTIEYPGGAPPKPYTPYVAPVPKARRAESEESDADAEGDEEEEDEDEDEEHNIDVEDLKLPSPLGNRGGADADADADAEAEDYDIELDLEAELEQALASETGNRGNESSESEEE